MANLDDLRDRFAPVTKPSTGPLDTGLPPSCREMANDTRLSTLARERAAEGEASLALAEWHFSQNLKRKA